MFPLKHCAKLGFVAVALLMLVRSEIAVAQEEPPWVGHKVYPFWGENIIHDSALNRGVCYAIGYGPATKNEERAVEYFRAAAESNPVAQHYLGYCYATGFGVAVNEIEAAKWYRKAAEGGNADASIRMGNCCATGSGVPKNEVEAAEWYRKAAEQQMPFLQKLCRELRRFTVLQFLGNCLVLLLALLLVFGGVLYFLGSITGKVVFASTFCMLVPALLVEVIPELFEFSFFVSGRMVLFAISIFVCISGFIQARRQTPLSARGFLPYMGQRIYFVQYDSSGRNIGRTEISAYDAPGTVKGKTATAMWCISCVIAILGLVAALFSGLPSQPGH